MFYNTSYMHTLSIHNFISKIMSTERGFFLKRRKLLSIENIFLGGQFSLFYLFNICLTVHR